MKFNFVVKTPDSFCLRRSAHAQCCRLLIVAGMLAFAASMPVLAQTQGATAQGQGTKIGFVNTERILRESAPAKAAQNRIDAEFKKRFDELQRMDADLRKQVEKFDKDAPVLSESDRTKRQRDLADLDADLQRKRREYQEDINRRRNSEFSDIVTKVNEAIKRIAEQDHYDLILQDAVSVGSRVDLTDRVIQSLGK
jgi:outer membrane protein